MWLTPTQCQIFTTVYQYGAKPASTIAKLAEQERTNVYKSCEVLVKKGLFAETSRGGVKHFFVPDKQVIQRMIDQQHELLDQSSQLVPLVEAELNELDQPWAQTLPAMRFYEGRSGIENCFTDLYDDIITSGLIIIKMFATNTLDTQSSSSKSLRDYGSVLFDKLQKQHIGVESYLGNGILTLESLFKTSNMSDITNLPAGNSAINCFIFGDLVYVIIYKNIPVAWRMRSEEFAQMLHFLLRSV